ncbi:MAG: HD domain-containing protein [Blastocatellia bacterium]
MTERETEILARAERLVRNRLQNDSSGHDWWHISRVRRLATQIGISENADIFVVQLAALLHDLDDYKLTGDRQPGIDYKLTGDLQPGIELPLATRWMADLEVDKDVVSLVREIITDLSYKGSEVATPMRTTEGMVVQDADRLDAIGAIGVARAFAYGGAKGRPLYDPEVKPVRHRSFEEYKSAKGPTINHFYEKLVLLKDLMNTTTAKRIAAGRHQFLTEFLDKFLAEWEGRDC